MSNALPERARQVYESRMKRALTVVAVAFVTDLKKQVSVPAPRRRTKSGRIVAATPATPGAPPRVVTGRGRASLSMRIEIQDKKIVIMVGAAYMMIHEEKNHKWIVPTWNANCQRYQALFVRAFNG